MPFWKNKKDDRSSSSQGDDQYDGDKKGDTTLETQSVKSSMSEAPTLTNEGSTTQPPVRYDKHGKPMADPSFLWGRTPNQELGENWKASEHPVNSMSEEEKEKLRKKGINPALKAEMDARGGDGKGKGAWMMLATSNYMK